MCQAELKEIGRQNSLKQILAWVEEEEDLYRFEDKIEIAVKYRR